MEALQYLKEKYEKEGNAIYFREPDLPMSTSLERICKYMQEYAESHTAAHTAALQERVKDLENELKLSEDTIKHQAERCLKLEAKLTRLDKECEYLSAENTDLSYQIEGVRHDNKVLRERVNELEEAMVVMKDYWNQERNDEAMNDALWFIIDTIDDLLEKKL